MCGNPFNGELKQTPPPGKIEPVGKGVKGDEYRYFMVRFAPAL
jgi:hypothetical protein